MTGFFGLALVLILAPVCLGLFRLMVELYVWKHRPAQSTSAIKSEIENFRWDMSQKN